MFYVDGMRRRECPLVPVSAGPRSKNNPNPNPNPDPDLNPIRKGVVLNERGLLITIRTPRFSQGRTWPKGLFDTGVSRVSVGRGRGLRGDIAPY